MSIPVEWLVGPVGALALALWVISALWQAHKASDLREQKRADDAEARLDAFLGKLKPPTR